MKYLFQLTVILLSVSNAVLKDVPRVKIGVKHKVEGCKRKSKIGDILYVNFKGSLEDGTVFDTNLLDGIPYRFTLGGNILFKGWNEGLTRMCVGEQRRLIIPPELGYGDKGSGLLVPPNAVLYFDVELVKINDKTEL